MPVPRLTSYQTSGSAQRSAGEPRQAGNGATVARRACVAGKSGVWPIRKDEGGRMKDEVVDSFAFAKLLTPLTLPLSSFRLHPSSFFLWPTR